MTRSKFRLSTARFREKIRYLYIAAVALCLLSVLWISEINGGNKDVLSVLENLVPAKLSRRHRPVYLKNGELSLFCLRCRRYPDVEISNLSECVDCYERVTNESSAAEARNKLLLEYHEKAKHSVKREQRLPDVIGLGVRKCGTSWLQHVLRKHPMIKTASREEMHFFNHRHNYVKGIEYYRSRMPHVSSYELAMEKTPGYFNFPQWSANIPQLIHEHVPNAKLWVILCDPARRAFSDFVHVNVTNEHEISFTFEEYVDEYLPLASKILGSSEDLIETSNLWRKRDYLSIVLTLGIYHPMMKEWLKYFPAESIHVVSGEEMMQNPGEVIEKLQDFLGVPRLLLSEDFEKNPETGLHCISPTLAIDSALYRIPKHCILTKFKGRTRAPIGSTYNVSNDVFRKLNEFYKPYNEELFKILGRRLW